MSIKVIVIVIAIYFTIGETQKNLRGDQNITSSVYDDYDYFDDFDNGPKRGDVGEIKIQQKFHNNRGKRSIQQQKQPIRGDQGPPPSDDFDYYSNFIDEEPKRGDIGQFTFNLQENYGSTADISRFPYQVSLVQYNNYTDQWEHHCGGSIISSNIILTAAHCTYFISKIDIAMHQVRIGSSSSISGGKLIKINKIINHEHFNSLNIDNDISMLILNERIKFSKNINRILIASKSRAAGTMSVVSGWGYLDETAGIPSPNLNYLNVPIINREECEKAYEDFEPLTNSMICAGYLEGGKDFCLIDSGGPLTEGDELIGIVSWGIGCGSKNKPGVYTDIFYMGEWIIDKLYLYSV